jgi:hypothetical protein
MQITPENKISSGSFVETQSPMPTKTQTSNFKSILQAENYQSPLSTIIRNDEKLRVVDIKNGAGEHLGNDMVLMIFSDGSRRATQKALFLAAEEADAIKLMESEKDFANWHLNTWGSTAADETNYGKAHEKFDLAQIRYNKVLIEKQPNISINRLKFVQKNAPKNQAAIDAAKMDIITYSTKQMEVSFPQNIGLQGASGKTNSKGPYNNDDTSKFESRFDSENSRNLEVNESLYKGVLVNSMEVLAQKLDLFDEITENSKTS